MRWYSVHSCKCGVSLDATELIFSMDIKSRALSGIAGSGVEGAEGIPVVCWL